jgi:hypothetical protein
LGSGRDQAPAKSSTNTKARIFQSIDASDLPSRIYVSGSHGGVFMRDSHEQIQHSKWKMTPQQPMKAGHYARMRKLSRDFTATVTWGQPEEPASPTGGKVEIAKQRRPKSQMGRARDLHMTSLENGLRNLTAMDHSASRNTAEPQVDPRMRGLKTAPDMVSTGIIVNGRKRKGLDKEDRILGSQVRLQHDEPESEETAHLMARTKAFGQRSKSYCAGGAKTPTAMHTHKRVFGDLNVTMAPGYDAEGFRSCAGKQSGLEERTKVSTAAMGFDESVSAGPKPARRMHTRSTDVAFASKFDLRHYASAPPVEEVTRATRRPRSPRIPDAFRSQFNIFAS